VCTIFWTISRTIPKYLGIVLAGRQLYVGWMTTCRAWRTKRPGGRAFALGAVLHNRRMATAVRRGVLLAVVRPVVEHTSRHAQCGAPQLPSSSTLDSCRPGCSAEYCGSRVQLQMTCCVWSWGAGPTSAGWTIASWIVPSSWRLCRLTDCLPGWQRLAGRVWHAKDCPACMLVWLHPSIVLSVSTLPSWQLRQTPPGQASSSSRIGQ
jgi:hypothetical protein